MNLKIHYLLEEVAEEAWLIADGDVVEDFPLPYFRPLPLELAAGGGGVTAVTEGTPG